MSWLIPGIAALGGLLSGRKSSRTQETYEPREFRPLRDVLIQRSMGRLQSPTSLPGGYISSGIQNINQNADTNRMQIENILTQRGLSSSPAAIPALAKAETNRLGSINQFQNIQAPAFEQQLQQQDFQNAINLFGQRALGTIQPGSMLGGAFNSAAEMLAYMYGNGAFGSGSRPTINPGNARG